MRTSRARTQPLSGGRLALIALLHVDELVDFGFHSASELDDYLSTIVRDPARLLEEHRRSIADLDVPARSLTAGGPPWQKILEVARDCRPGSSSSPSRARGAWSGCCSARRRSA